MIRPPSSCRSRPRVASTAPPPASATSANAESHGSRSAPERSCRVGGSAPAGRAPPPTRSGSPPSWPGPHRPGRAARRTSTRAGRSRQRRTCRSRSSRRPRCRSPGRSQGLGGGDRGQHGGGLVPGLLLLGGRVGVGHDPRRRPARTPARRASARYGSRSPCPGRRRSRSSRRCRRRGPRRVGSSSSMISMARTLGAPDRVPAGKVAASASKRRPVLAQRRRPPWRRCA